MHNASDQNYHRGYEWWLIQEAKKVRSHIRDSLVAGTLGCR